MFLNLDIYAHNFGKFFGKFIGNSWGNNTYIDLMNIRSLSGPQPMCFSQSPGVLLPCVIP